MLVATDFSKTSHRAPEHALSLANVEFQNLSGACQSRGPYDGSGTCGSFTKAYAPGRSEMERILTSGRFSGAPHEEFAEEG